MAELPFGFWRYLLERRYQTTLWPQALRRGFPHLGAGGRRVLRDTVLDLQGLRNRIAHHEPIHGIDLSRRHRQSLDVAGYIDPAAARWVQRLSRVPSGSPASPTIGTGRPRLTAWQRPTGRAPLRSGPMRRAELTIVAVPPASARAVIG